MTSETRTLLEPKDIVGMEIECHECHMTIFYPTAVKEVIKIVSYCPHCSHKLFDEVQSREFGSVSCPAIESLQTVVANLRALVRADRTDIHAQIRYRVNVESKVAK
ncbi:MAG TPA: hypothetical protein VGG14_16190 [Candidatus Sulfotelmatobacter sp.]|jgi:DNA-directed RNA polymerase subunit RPC12/RpoP